MDKQIVLKEFGLENFRVFKDKTNFELAPITLLTGPNSSGKSSVIKAMKLMQNFHTDNFLDPESDQELTFRENENHPYHHQLGDFEFIINNGNKENKEISVLYTIPPYVNKYASYMAFGNKKELLKTLESFREIWDYHGNIYVENIFSLDPNSELKNGKLKKTSIFLDHNEEKVKIIEWHHDNATFDSLDMQKSSNPDDWQRREGKIQEWNGYADFPILLKSFMPQLGSQNAKTDFSKSILKSVLEISSDKLDELEIHLCDIVTQKYPEKLKNLTHESFHKIIQEIDKEISSLENEVGSLKQPIGLLSYRKKQYNDSLSAIKNYLKNPFQRISIFVEMDWSNRAQFLNRNEAYAQWLSVTDYLSLLDFCLRNLGEKSVSEYYSENKEDMMQSCQYDFLYDFLEDVNKYTNAAIQVFYEECEFIESTKANTQRLYTFTSQGTSFNKLLSEFFNVPHTKESELFINKWIREFEIGESIQPDIIRGVGVQLNIMRGDNSINIVDLGYATTQTIALILRIISAYEADKKNIIIEEPDTHLHPKLQSKLADLFIDAHEKLGLNFIIETHSEYLIRKLQYLTAKKTIRPDDTVIYYIGNPNPSMREPGEEQVRKINIKPNGHLSQPFGKGFFDEADSLVSELWKHTKE